MLDDQRQAIRRIRAALLRRSDRAWSVKAGHGTVGSTIYITSPPRRRPDTSLMTDEDRKELARLLGREIGVHPQGVQVTWDERDEYVRRAENDPPEASKEIDE